MPSAIKEIFCFICRSRFPALRQNPQLPSKSRQASLTFRFKIPFAVRHSFHLPNTATHFPFDPAAQKPHPIRTTSELPCYCRKRPEDFILGVDRLTGLSTRSGKFRHFMLRLQGKLRQAQKKSPPPFHFVRSSLISGR